MLNLFRKKRWPPDHSTPPWGDRPSIYAHIAAHMDPAQKVGLREGGERLPDEKDPDPTTISFAPGAMDGAFGHHAGPAIPEEQVLQDLHAALTAALRDASEQNIRTFYAKLTSGSALDVIDQLIDRIFKASDIDAGRLRELAHWIATKGADREAVKTAMALLGLPRRYPDLPASRPP
jgi:hypothetical protein